MANTSSRTLRLLSLLQTHRFWPGAELATRLGVSVRTLRRDVDRLRELGYPVQANRGVDGGYQLAPGAALPPLVLDDEEAVALAVGLQAAAQTGIAGVAETSVRALGKVVQVMPARLRRRVEALGAVTQPASLTGGPVVDPGILTALAEACRAEERIEFSYTAADGAASARLVEPLRLVPLGRRWYLVAYDLLRHDWRTFRLDRIATPQRTGVRFRPRDLPAPDAAAYVTAAVGRRSDVVEVEFLVTLPADRVRAEIGRWASVTEADAGCRVRMRTDSLHWPAMAIGVLGAQVGEAAVPTVTVVSPPELLDHLRSWARTFEHADAAAPPRSD